MNEESKEISQNAEATPEQQSPEVSKPTEAEPKIETPDKSINRGGGWKGFLKRIGIGGAAATAVVTGIGMAATEATAVEKPTTSISQTTSETRDDDDGITEKDGHVVKTDRKHDAFTVTEIDKDKVVVKGKDIMAENYEPSESVDKGITELAGIGMDIKNVETHDTALGKDGEAIVEVDDTIKLDRFKHISDESIKEDGHVVRINKDHTYDMGKVNDKTIMIKGEYKDGGAPWDDLSSKEEVEKGKDDLKKAGMEIKSVTPIKLPTNDGYNEEPIVKVEVDDANKLDNLAKEDK